MPIPNIMWSSIHVLLCQVLIVSEEDQVPYMRPPLSKELWFSEDRDAAKLFEFKQWNGRKRSIFFEKKNFYCQPSELSRKEGGVAIALKKRVRYFLEPSPFCVFKIFVLEFKQGRDKKRR